MGSGGSRKSIRGWRSRSTIVFKGVKLHFIFHLCLKKHEKQLREGMAVTGSPTIGAAIEYGQSWI
jgi:hypothetical protein